MYQFLSYLKIALNIIVYLFFYIFATNTKSVKHNEVITSYDYSLIYVFKAYIVIFVAIMTLIMNKMFS